MNAEMPLAPLSGSVTAITVYQVDLPPLVIQHLVPLRIQSSPSRGPGAHRGGVAAGLALGQRVGRHRLAGGDGRQHLLLQLLGAAQDQAHRAQLVDRGDQRRRRADPRDLLDHDAGRHRVGALAAVLLGDVHRVEPGRVQRLQRLLREARILVDVGGVRGDLLLAEIPQHRAQLVVLLGQLEHIEDRVTSHAELLATRR